MLVWTSRSLLVLAGALLAIVLNQAIPSALALSSLAMCSAFVNALALHASDWLAPRPRPGVESEGQAVFRGKAAPSRRARLHARMTVGLGVFWAVVAVLGLGSLESAATLPVCVGTICAALSIMALGIHDLTDIRLRDDVGEIAAAMRESRSPGNMNRPDTFASDDDRHNSDRPG